MTGAIPQYLQPYAQPDPTVTLFPVPTLYQPESPGIGANTYESFSLASIPMPGQWVLTDCTRVFGWQIQQAFGLTGATVLPIGDPLLKAKFAVKIWTNADAQQYQLALKTVLRKPAYAVPGAAVTAGMGIDQKQLLSVGVDTVVLWSVTPLINPLVTSGGKGAWTATVEFLEYRAPQPAIAKPSQKIPDKAPPMPSAQDAADLETVRLRAEWAAAGGRLTKTIAGLGPTP